MPCVWSIGLNIGGNLHLKCVLLYKLLCALRKAHAIKRNTQLSSRPQLCAACFSYTEEHESSPLLFKGSLHALAPLDWRNMNPSLRKRPGKFTVQCAIAMHSGFPFAKLNGLNGLFGLSSEHISNPRSHSGDLRSNNSSS